MVTVWLALCNIRSAKWVGPTKSLTWVPYSMNGRDISRAARVWDRGRSILVGDVMLSLIFVYFLM